MFYTILWLVVWLIVGNTTFTFGTGGAFWALVVAIIADVLWVGYGRKWYFRPQ